MQSKNDGSSPVAIGDRDYTEYLKTVFMGNNDPIWFAKNILGVDLFPMQAKVLSEFYSGGYKKLIMPCGMRSGKSALAAVFGAKELFELMTIPNPAEKWGLLPNQPVFISMVATSTTQAIDSVFANLSSMVEDSEFFQTWTDLRCKEMLIESKEKHVKVRTLSSWSTTAVGRSNKAVIFDELANFEETSGKRGAWEIYTRLAKSTDTFGKDGHIMAISSPKHPNDIIMTLYGRAKKEDNTYAIMKPTWEMNPNFSEEELREEYKYDMPAFYRDYACQPFAFSSVQFPEGVSLNIDMRNVLEFTHVRDFSHERVCAIDPAVKNDSFGIGVGYMDNSGRIVIDGIHKFTKHEGDVYIKPSDVKTFLDRVINNLNVYSFIFDTWMFPELIEHVEDSYGLEVVKHIVRKEDYDRWRELQSSEMVDVVYDEFLQVEAEQLVVKNDKNVDHPFSGSKDMSDCAANIMWYLATNDILDRKPAIMSLGVM